MTCAVTNTQLPKDIEDAYKKIYFVGPPKKAIEYGYTYVDNCEFNENSSYQFYISLEEDDALTLLLLSGFGCYYPAAIITKNNLILEICFPAIESSCLANNLVFSLYCLRNVDPSMYEAVRLQYSVTTALHNTRTALESTMVDKLKDIYER